MTTINIGKLGEEIALNYLESKGFTHISSNQHFTTGEIDLIMQDGEFIVFVEVKSLQSFSPFSIYETLTKKKKWRLKKAVNAWLAKNNKQSSIWRMDFVGVILDNHLNAEKIEHFEFIEL